MRFILPAAAVAVAGSTLLPAGGGPAAQSIPNDIVTGLHAAKLIREGREIFRFDTFGSEAFWGGALRLHEAIAGAANGGTGPGLSPARPSRSA